MKRAILVVAGILLLPLMMSACSNKPVGNQAGNRQFEEDCDVAHECMSGLICESGKCRQLCQTNDKEICPDGYTCTDNRCVKISIKPGDNTDDPGDNTDGPGDNTDDPGDNTDIPGTQSLGENCNEQNTV